MLCTPRNSTPHPYNVTKTLVSRTGS